MTKWKATRLRARAIAAALVVCAWLVFPGAAQQPANQQSVAARVAPVGTDAGAPEIQVQRIRRNVYMLVGDGANITLQTELPAGEENYDSIYGGDVGVLVVDTGTQAMGDQLVAAIRKLSSGSIRYIVNTSADADHVGGNEALAKVSGGIVRGALGGRPSGPQLVVLAHETVLERMGAPSGQQAAYALDAWPTDVFARDKEAFFNGGSIKITHQPGAHTDGDSIVYLRRSDVVSAGEIFSTTNFPKIDAAKGGHIQGIVDGLNRIMEIAIPGEKEQGGTMIVPAHGRLSDEADVEAYREMVQIVRDRILDGIKNGMTLDQVKAGRPALEYERLYSKPEWTTDMFVEAVYKDLSQTAAPKTEKSTAAPKAAPAIQGTAAPAKR
jgi:cyclase